MRAFLVFAIAGVGLGLAGQDVKGVPTVFRRVHVGGLFPQLEVADLFGSKQILSAKCDRASVMAFLRPDQEDSRSVLEALAKLALDQEGAPGRLIVLGLRGRTLGSWTTLSKGLPKRVSLYLDKYGAAKSVGVIVVPSIAVLDSDGRLRSSFVLFDAKLEENLRRRLHALALGESIVPDEDERRQLRYQRNAANAAGMESAGMLQEAVRLLQQNLESGLHPAQDHDLLGHLYMRLEDPATAITHLRRSLELDSTIPVRVSLGRALLANGNLEEAKTQLTTAIDLSPKKAVIHHALAQIAKAQQDIDTALKHMRAAIDAARQRADGGRNDHR